VKFESKASRSRRAKIKFENVIWEIAKFNLKVSNAYKEIGTKVIDNLYNEIFKNVL
jgi:hypothetical protein